MVVVTTSLVAVGIRVTVELGGSVLGVGDQRLAVVRDTEVHVVLPVHGAEHRLL